MQNNSRKYSPKLISWIITCLVVALASVLYRVLVLSHLEQTSLLFIGIPLFLSIGLAMTPQPKSVTGVVMKGITLALLFSGILFIEGVICIIMAAPLFYLIGAIVSWVIGKSKKRNRLNCSVLAVLFIVSMEGVVEVLSFDREEVVTVQKDVALTLDESVSKLALGPDFHLHELPPFLRLGFPLPQKIEGSGMKIGDRRVIHFAGGEGKPGDLVLEVMAVAPQSITYRCVTDSSHVSHWLDWKTITWKVKRETDTLSQVEIILSYNRLLDPAWYFKPIERYGVRKAGEFLIDQTFN